MKTIMMVGCLVMAGFCHAQNTYVLKSDVDAWLLDENGNKVKSESINSGTKITIVSDDAQTPSAKTGDISLPPGTPSELLLKYTAQGELPYVEAVLKQNPALDINRPRTAGNKTALYIACEKGYVDIVIFLLGKKADVSICDTEAETYNRGTAYSPLTIAARNGHLAVVKVLLSSGVGIEARDEGDRTALYAAAAGNKSDMVRFLCESNAKVNILARFNNWSPLSVAVYNGYVQVLKALLKYGKGIDLEMCDKAGNTPLFNAVIGNKADIVQLLCEYNAKVNIHGGYQGGQTPLTSAVDKGYADVVKVLLDYGKGIDLEMCDKWGNTPLFSAVTGTRSDIVQLLCERNAKVNIYGGPWRKWTPLTITASSGKTDMVKVLLKYGKGIDLKMPNKWGATPLAAASDHEDVVRILKEYEAEQHK